MEESSASWSLSRRTLLKAGSLIIGGVAASQALCEVPPINVEDYGASVDSSAEDNLNAFARAIDATPTGGSILVPKRSGTYWIDTSGGLSQALSIERQMTIVIEGEIRSSYGKLGPNPPYIFSAKANDVQFTGHGLIAGPGTADDTNSFDDTHHPGLIRVTGDRFSFVGPEVRDVPKIGIHLWNCREATISTNWKGGIEHYTRGHTALFGIRATGGGGHRITGNRFERDAKGRRLITGYFSGGLMGETQGDTITHNFADVHEKLAYLYTSNSVVRDCRVINALRTDSLRVVGSGNLVERLVGERVKGGVSVYNGSHNIIRDCTFSGVEQEGVFVSFLEDYRGSYAGTVITGNSITAASSNVRLQDAICLYLGGVDTRDIAVTDNRIESSGGRHLAQWYSDCRDPSIRRGSY